MLTLVGRPTVPAQRTAAKQDATEHRWWCREVDCVSTDDEIAHRSVKSTVMTETGPGWNAVNVWVEDFFTSDSGGNWVYDDGDRLVLLQTNVRQNVDPVYLTVEQARLVAAAFETQLAAADDAESPIERAATLLVGALGHTGRDGWALRGALIDVLDNIVEALAEGRRPVS